MEHVLTTCPSADQAIEKASLGLASLIAKECPEDLKPYLAGIDYSNVLTMLISPSMLQFLDNPTEEEWMSLNPDLKTVRSGSATRRQSLIMLLLVTRVCCQSLNLPPSTVCIRIRINYESCLVIF